MKRELIDVIDQMLAAIPAENVEDGRDIVRADLNKIRTSQMYRAPEDMIGWDCVSNILNDFTFNAETPIWKLKLCSIFSTIPLEQIMQQVKNMK